MAKKIHSIDLWANYRFCGNGQGIPGLPHEVTGSQARELGLLDVLKAALENGNYRVVNMTSTTHVAETGE